MNPAQEFCLHCSSDSENFSAAAAAAAQVNVYLLTFKTLDDATTTELCGVIHMLRNIWHTCQIFKRNT
jgi:hypothetical protein